MSNHHESSHCENKCAFCRMLILVVLCVNEVTISTDCKTRYVTLFMPFASFCCYNTRLYRVGSTEIGNQN